MEKAGLSSFFSCKVTPRSARCFRDLTPYLSCVGYDKSLPGLLYDLHVERMAVVAPELGRRRIEWCCILTKIIPLIGM